MPERDPEVTAWSPPPLEQCDEERIPVPLDEEYLLSMRRVLWSGQLVAFAIVLSQCVGGQWVEIVCIDTLHHGCVHRHDGDHDKPFKSIRDLNSQQDVQESFHDAYDDVYNEYLRARGLDELR